MYVAGLKVMLLTEPLLTVTTEDVDDFPSATAEIVAVPTALLVIDNVLPFGVYDIALSDELTFHETDLFVALEGDTVAVNVVDAFSPVSVTDVLFNVTEVIGFSALTNLFLELLYSSGYSSISSDIVIPNFLYYMFYVVVVCIAPAVCEEILFRGLICILCFGIFFPIGE